MVGGLLKRLFVGDRSADATRLADRIGGRLDMGERASVAAFAEAFLPGEKREYARHQVAMAAQILVNRGRARAEMDGRAIDPLNGDPERTVLSAHRRG